MIGSDELLRRFRGLERAELVRWIENRWILPDAAAAVASGCFARSTSRGSS